MSFCVAWDREAKALEVLELADLEAFNFGCLLTGAEGKALIQVHTRKQAADLACAGLAYAVDLSGERYGYMAKARA